MQKELIELYKEIAIEQVRLEIQQKFEEEGSNFIFPNCTQEEAEEALEKFINLLYK